MPSQRHPLPAILVRETRNQAKPISSTGWYGTEYATDPYPRHFKLGGWYNSAPFNDPYLSTRDRSWALFGGRPLVWSEGRGGAYLLGDQVVRRAPDPTRRGIAVFATTGVPFDGKGLFSFEGLAGSIWTGPFPSRPTDQIGAMGTYIRLLDKEDGTVNDLLRKARSSTLVSRNQGIFEANHNYRVIEGIYLAGSLQYLVNPDPISRPSARFAPRDVLVVGLTLSVSMGGLLGLPASLVEEQEFDGCARATANAGPPRWRPASTPSAA